MKVSSMKKVVSVVLATSMLFSAQFVATSVFAATKTSVATKANVKLVSNSVKPKVPALKVNPITIVLDGKNVSIDAVTQSGATLVNLRTFVGQVGATMANNAKTRTTTVKRNAVTLALKADDKFVSLNNQKKFITHAPRVVNGRTFVELNQLTTLLGGEVLTQEDGSNEYVSFKILEGAINPQWLNESTVLLTKQGETSFEHYTVNIDNRKYTKLNITVDTEIVEVSPDGTKIAYTNDDSNVYVYNLAFDKENKISEDTVTKLELTWADDSNSLYYIDGEKQSAISNITIADGVITKLVDDKVDYKSDLFVLSNTTLLYTVTKQSKVTQDTSGIKDGEDLPDFDVTIDPAGTEPTLFKVDLTAEVRTPAAITTTLENKTNTGLLANGTAVYLSTDFNDENAVPILRTIDSKLAGTNHILFNVELISSQVVADNKLIVLGIVKEEDKEGNVVEKQFVFEVEPQKGKAKTIAEAPLEISTVKADLAKNSLVAQDVDGKTYIWKNEKWFLLAR
jgi:hypothetical protein